MDRKKGEPHVTICNSEKTEETDTQKPKGMSAVTSKVQTRLGRKTKRIRATASVATGPS